MKKINNSEFWCHITCGLFSKYRINIKDYLKISFEFN